MTTAIDILDTDLAGLLDELLKVAAVPGTRVALVHRRTIDVRYEVSAALARADAWVKFSPNNNRIELANGSLLLIIRVADYDDACRQGGAEWATLAVDDLGTWEPVVVEYLTSRLRCSEAIAEALRAADLQPCRAIATVGVEAGP